MFDSQSTGETLEVRDAYKRFFGKFDIDPEAFFEFALEETICAPIAAAQEEWDDLKRRIAEGAPVSIRGYGRNGGSTNYFRILYSGLLGHDAIDADKTNNAEPSKALRRATLHSKRVSLGYTLLANYQVSHVFGRTKNPYAFTAPWNIVYIPKIADPFTGHEAPGALSRRFQTRFQSRIYEIYRPLIEDFNDVMTSERIAKRVEPILDRMETVLSFPKGFRDDVRESLAPIPPPLMSTPDLVTL